MLETILHRLMQRYIMEGGEENLSACVSLLEQAPSAKHAKILIGGLREGLLGRELVELPQELLEALDAYGDEMGEAPLTLALRQGAGEALQEAMKVVSDPGADIATRLSYVEVMGETTLSEAVPELMKLVRSGASTPVVKQAALHALQGYDSDEIGQKMAAAYPAFRDNAFVRE